MKYTKLKATEYCRLLTKYFKLVIAFKISHNYCLHFSNNTMASLNQSPTYTSLNSNSDTYFTNSFDTNETQYEQKLAKHLKMIYTRNHIIYLAYLNEKAHYYVGLRFNTSFKILST